MTCERCHKTADGMTLFDYCASCGKNLCEDCIDDGCCGVAPAESGILDDYGNDE